MKDKEWLKNEILGLSIKARHKENNQREWHMGHVMALFDVNKLIDQLDEPELTQDQVDKYLYERNFVAVDVMMVHQTGMQNKVVVEKPVVPQFVAEWIDTHNLYGNNPLREYRDLENDFNEGWTNEKDAAVYHWVNKNPYAFIDMLRYGYEVEKEKRYYIINKENNATLMTFELSDVVGEEIIEFVDTYSENETVHFDSKEKAELIAHFVGDFVEVEEVKE